MKGFINFIKEQGVVGLAIGFILGGAVGVLVASFVNDIINPLLGLLLGKAGGLTSVSIKIGSAHVMIGSFLNNLINFAVIAAVVYFVVKGLGLDKLDNKK